MRLFVPIIILVILFAIAGGVIYGFYRGKQKRDAEMTEFYLCETRFKKASESSDDGEGDYQEAARILEIFLRDHPKSEKAADAYYYLAKSREELGDRPQAMEAWGKIIEMYPSGPNIPEAYYYLGAGYQEQGEYDKAMENYKMVVNRFSNMSVAAGAWHGIGRICETRGQESEAIAAYQNVMAKYANTEFSHDAERRWGNINLRKFLEENTISYEVRRGDSLEKIGAKLGVTPELIMRLNNLTTNMLQLGQVLKVTKPNLNILVDLSRLKLSLRAGDKLIKRYTISIGKEDTPTPTGDFKVTDKLKDPVWYSTLPSGAKEAIKPGDPRNELGIRWIGFKPAYGIHGTIDPDSIGKAMSKGCVRMHNKDVEELYDLVAIGIPVRIVSGADQI